MLEIRYSAPYDLDVSGTVDELQIVQRAILDLIKSENTQISFEANDAIDAAPYESALSKLVIVKGQGPTKVSHSNDKEIHVEGSPSCLEAFASFFAFTPESEKGAHSHYEYYEGNEWIAPESIPLVIGVQ